MPENRNVSRYLKRETILIILAGTYGLGLFIAAFLTYGNTVGILGLLLVMAASILWGTRGGIISAFWAALCLLASLFFSPYPVAAQHIYFYYVGAGLLFLTGAGLGISISFIRHQKSQLQKRDEKFRLIFELSPFGELHFDSEGNVTACNDNMVRIIGSPRRILLGFHLLRLPDKKVVRAVRGALQGETTTYQGEYCSVTSSKVTPVRAIFAPIIQKGRVQGGFGIVEDISLRWKAEVRIRDSEEKFRQMAAHMEEVFWLRSRDNQKLLYISPAYEKVWGRSCRSLYDDPNTFMDSIHPEDMDLVSAQYSQYMDGGTFDLEYRIVRPDGEVRWIWARSFPVRDEGGQIIRHTGIAVDITERKKAEENLHYQLAFQKMVTDISASFVNSPAHDLDEAINFALQLSGTFFQADRGYLFLFTHNGEKMDNTHEWCAPGIEPQMERIKDVPVDSMPWWARQIRSHKPVHIPDIAKLPPEAKAEKEEFAAQGIQSLLSIPITMDGKLTGFFGFDSVREKKTWGEWQIYFLHVIGGILSGALQKRESQNRLRHLSLHDQLTGLYNRTFFEKELKRLKEKGSKPVSFISIDLDGLKIVNDTLGHARGDELLKNCAEVIKNSLRQSAILARVGGDEFIVILERAGTRAGKDVMERIRQRIKDHNSRLKDAELPLTMSMGIATAEEGDTRTLDDVLVEADHRMYRAKAQKGSGARHQIINALMAVLGERDLLGAQQLATFCHMVGERMGLSAKQLSDLSLLCHIHNLGMLGIPETILGKKGPLNPGEWEAIRQHPEKGYRIALSSPELSGLADLVLKHHERWDGSGYPAGIKGKDIPIECRIFSVVEAYDAMTSERPYRKAMSHEKAMGEIKGGSGSQFDPYVVEFFLLILDMPLVREA